MDQLVVRPVPQEASQPQAPLLARPVQQTAQVAQMPRLAVPVMRVTDYLPTPVPSALQSSSQLEAVLPAQSVLQEPTHTQVPLRARFAQLTAPTATCPKTAQLVLLGTVGTRINITPVSAPNAVQTISQLAAQAVVRPVPQEPSRPQVLLHARPVPPDAPAAQMPRLAAPVTQASDCLLAPVPNALPTSSRQVGLLLAPPVLQGASRPQVLLRARLVLMDAHSAPQ